MQGFQLIVDADDGFSGLGASCIQHLRDEYGKSILTFPVIDAASRDKSVHDYIKVINTVLSWHHIGEHCSLFSPLCSSSNAWPVPSKPHIFQNITYKSDLKYHTSALLATALDTLSLRYRHRKYAISNLSDLCADLNKLGRKAVATSLSLPFPMHDNQDLLDILDDLDGSTPWLTLTPNCNITMDNNMQSLALRGIPEDRLKRPMGYGVKQMEKEAYKCSSVHEMMSLYLDCACKGTATYLITMEKGLRITDPYPKIFNSNIQKDGFISKSIRTEDVKCIPVMSGFHNGQFLVDMYKRLYEQVTKIRSIKRFHAFQESGLEQDEFEESINNLLDCKENYEERVV